MAIVDGIIQPHYALKSLIKAFLFLGGPHIYSLYHKDGKWLSIFKFRKKGMLISLMLGLMVYVVIILAYFLFKKIFDFSNITNSITKNGITAKNFFYVSLYISFANSLLEEFFFRGFAFWSLKRMSTRKWPYMFSSIAFAAYHIAIMIGWFSIMEYALIMAGLFAGAMIFNYLNEKLDCIYPSWFVHMFANFAINTIGMILFGII
jgi:membrane protease YdiL (CAAX protease family)